MFTGHVSRIVKGETVTADTPEDTPDDTAGIATIPQPPKEPEIPPFNPIAEPPFESDYLYTMTENKHCGTRHVYINDGNGNCNSLNPEHSDCRWMQGPPQECQELCDKHDICKGFNYIKPGEPSSGGLGKVGKGACYFRADPEEIGNTDNARRCYAKGDKIIGEGVGCSQCDIPGWSLEDNTQWQGTKLIAEHEKIPNDAVTCAECDFSEKNVPSNGNIYVNRACPGVMQDETEKFAEICELVCRNYQDGECVGFNYYKASKQCLLMSSVYGKRWDKPDNICGTPCA